MRARFVCGCLLAVVCNSSLAQTLWYGGDWIISSGFFANTVVLNLPDSSFEVFDDFQIPPGARWHVSGLLSNNVTEDPQTPPPLTQAVWSIRTSVAEGNFGQIIYSGIGPATVTPTGRTAGTFVEYSVLVSGLSIDLGPGTYFFNVTPVSRGDSVPFGSANSVGLAGPSGIFQENNQGPNGNMIQVAPTGSASMGIIGAVVADVPTLTRFGYLYLAAALLALGLIAMKSNRRYNAG